MKNDRPLTVPEVALKIRRSEKTVRRLIDDAQFKCLKIRGSLLVWESSVDDYLERQTALWCAENGYVDGQ